MQHAFEQEAKLIISVLQKAHAQISAIDNTEMDARKYAILNDLKKHENALRLETGEDISTNELQPKSSAIGGPLTKIFGREIPKKQDAKPAEETIQKPAIKTDEQIALEELRQEVDNLFTRFVATPTEDLLDRESDIALRGVAKKAGLPVTETSPKKVDAKFVEKIKEAITKAEEIANLGKSQTATE